VNLLAHARRNVSQMTLPDDLVPEKASDAYAINQVVAERLGWEPLAGRLPARRMPRAASCNWTDRSMAGRSAALPAPRPRNCSTRSAPANMSARFGEAATIEIAIDL